MQSRRIFPYRMISSLLAAVILCCALPGTVSAQARSSQLSFLENFAVKLYERGDRDQAVKEFERILRIDPESAVAKRYLKDIATTPSGPAVPRSAADKANSITQDIRSLRTDIASSENDVKTLESLVRTLITENDDLYMAVSKRTREVLDLREKLYGTSYADQRAALMAELPPERIPQHPYRSEDILSSAYSLPSDPADAAKKFQKADAEVNALVAEVSAREQELQNLTAKGAQGMSAEQFRRTLEEKRNALVDKTSALKEKKDNLVGLKNDLVSINSDLKAANNRYLELIDKIDSYYQSVKTEIASKKYVEQKVFSDLMDDYAKKTSELEALKSSIDSRQAALTNYKAPLAAKDEELKNIDAALTAKDAELAALRDQLAKSKAEIAQKNGVITEQKGQLDFTDHTLSSLNAQIKDIQQLLSDSNSDIADLSGGISRIKTLLHDQKALGEKKARSIETLTETSGGAATEVKDLKQKVAELESKLSSKDTQINALNETLAQAKDKAAQADMLKTQKNPLTRELDQASPKPTPPKVSGEAITATRTDIQNKELDLKEKEIALEEMRTNLNQRTLALSGAEDQIKELEINILALESKQQAIRSVVDKRDDEVEQAKRQCNAAQKDAYTLTKEKKTFDLKLKEAQTLAIRTNRRLKESDLKLATAQAQIDQLNKDLEKSQALLLNHDKDAATINQLKDELCKRDAIIAQLQAQLSQKDKTAARTTEEGKKVKELQAEEILKIKDEQKVAPSDRKVPANVSTGCPGCVDYK